MSNITLKELARLLGLSISSVSKALNDSHEISVDTKKRVHKMALEYDYKPNILAKSLKTGRSNTLGIVIPFIGNSFQSQILEGAHQAAYANNYKLVFMQSRENAQLEEESLYALVQQNIDGIVISPSANSNLEVLNTIHQKTPIVLVDRIDFDFDTHKIGVDSERGAYEATQHLIDQGRKKIFVLAGRNIGVTRQRISGYKKALLANCIDFDDRYVVQADYGQTTADLIANLKIELLKRLPTTGEPIGLLGTTDTLTVSSLGILASLGYHVPQDIAVIGFANTEVADSLNPPLSTIVQPAIEIGYKGVEKLIELIKTKDGSHINYKTIKMSPSIVLRQSTKT